MAILGLGRNLKEKMSNAEGIKAAMFTIYDLREQVQKSLCTCFWPTVLSLRLTMFSTEQASTWSSVRTSSVCLSVCEMEACDPADRLSFDHKPNIDTLTTQQGQTEQQETSVTEHELRLWGSTLGLQCHMLVFSTWRCFHFVGKIKLLNYIHKHSGSTFRICSLRIFLIYMFLHCDSQLCYFSSSHSSLFWLKISLHRRPL